ncbi:glycosyltransferase family 87 protein [Nocardioides guangzhouensis]|uniref:glycosyltransferase family 87 protein n=1 Tax=Nocardioides guangzhouensis TaxID=2497878 RepID=UPI0014383684|nr:glycosyltransferase family 87 protein [Nocardioides guangzhouensis]
MSQGIIGRLNLALCWVLAAATALLAVHFALTLGYLGQDAHAYWATRDGDLYGVGPRREDAFLYSPAFALAIWPMVQLPWPAFFVAWVAIESAALVWLVRPIPLRWAVPVVLFCVCELLPGNVFLLLAVMIALGVRHPAAWAFGILTKVTPGIGVLWFAARGQWRDVGTAVVATLAVVLVSAAVKPGWWEQWWSFLVTHSGESDPTFLPRCVAAFAIVVWGARTDRPWVLAVAVVMALPVHGTFACLTPLAAIPRLLEGMKATDGSTLEPDHGTRV